MPSIDFKERTQERKKRDIHTHNIHMGRGGGLVVLSFRDGVSRGKPPPRYDDPLTPRHMSGKTGRNGSDGIRRLARSGQQQRGQDFGVLVVACAAAAVLLSPLLPNHPLCWSKLADTAGHRLRACKHADDAQQYRLGAALPIRFLC